MLKHALVASTCVLALSACEKVRDYYLVEPVVVPYGLDAKTVIDKDYQKPIDLNKLKMCRTTQGFSAAAQDPDQPTAPRPAPTIVVQVTPEGEQAPPPPPLPPMPQPAGASGEVCVPAFAAAVEGQSKEIRNVIVEKLINHSNRNCDIHKAAILSNSATFDFGFGLGSTVLSAISSAVGGEAVKTGFSTASAAVGATGTAINANFYQNLFATAIIREIDRKRSEVTAGLKENMKKDYGEYSAYEAVREVEIYHQECSFYKGVVALTSETKKGLTKKDVDQRLAQIQTEITGLQTRFTQLSADPNQQDQARRVNEQILDLETEARGLRAARRLIPEPEPNPQTDS